MIPKASDILVRQRRTLRTRSTDWWKLLGDYGPESSYLEVGGCYKELDGVLTSMLRTQSEDGGKSVNNPVCLLVDNPESIRRLVRQKRML